jgi:hypothetical protein
MIWLRSPVSAEGAADVAVKNVKKVWQKMTTDRVVLRDGHSSSQPPALHALSARPGHDRGRDPASELHDVVRSRASITRIMPLIRTAESARRSHVLGCHAGKGGPAAQRTQAGCRRPFRRPTPLPHDGLSSLPFLPRNAPQTPSTPRRGRSPHADEATAAEGNAHCLKGDNRTQTTRRRPVC